MSLKVTAQEWKSWKTSKDIVALFSFQEEIPQLLGTPKDENHKHLAQIAKEDGFKAQAGETFLCRPPRGIPATRVLLIGLGKQSEFTTDVLRRASAKAVKAAEAAGLSELAVRAPELAKGVSEYLQEIQALAEGLYLGTYKFTKHKTPVTDAAKPLAHIILLVEGVSSNVTKGIERAELFSRATMLARDLINEPPTRMNPEILARTATQSVKKPITVKVYEKKDLEKMGMGGILGVGAGSAVPPCLVELGYKPPKKARKVVALVGKGITFDSGGLSLKPAASMETMKDDMSGAATVLAVMSVLADLDLEIEVRGYLAIAENMPGGHATKPGDVLKSFNGKTIEVLNTDAEGRLVLADALSYAASKKPDLIIDVATLTGACVVALGALYSAIMANTPTLIQGLINAGEKAGEKFWELPLAKEYQPDIKSKIADVQNIGAKRGEAGTIIGGLFLQEFVDGTSWAHIDIAGPSWTSSDTALCPTGATGNPVRTLLHYLETL